MTDVYEPNPRKRKLYRVVEDGELGFWGKRSRTYTSAAEALKQIRRLQNPPGHPNGIAGRLYEVYVSDISPEREGYGELLDDAGEPGHRKGA